MSLESGGVQEGAQLLCAVAVQEKVCTLYGRMYGLTHTAHTHTHMLIVAQMWRILTHAWRKHAT